MEGFTLEPFSTQIDWQAARSLLLEEWAEIMKSFLDIIGKKIGCQENTVIGHIKGFASFSENSYIQISKVSSTHPATANLENLDSRDQDNLEFSLNIIAYGLPGSTSARIAEQAAIEITEDYQLQVCFNQLSKPVSHNCIHKGSK